MPKPISQEVRELIIYHKQKRSKNAEISEWLRVSVKSVKRIWQMYRKENTIAPKVNNSGRKAAFCDVKLKKITEKIREQPDLTLEETIKTFHINISASALSRKLIKIDLSFKKRRYMQKNNFALMLPGFVVSGSNI
jgi:transposase